MVGRLTTGWLHAGNDLRFLPPPPRPLAIRGLEGPLVAFHREREREREREGAFHVSSAIEELPLPSPLVVFAKRRREGGSSVGWNPKNMEAWINSESKIYYKELILLHNSISKNGQKRMNSRFPGFGINSSLGVGVQRRYNYSVSKVAWIGHLAIFTQHKKLNKRDIIFS